MNQTLYDALTLIVPLVLAIVIHEVSHGWVARSLGDPTAQDRGRLTLNPIRHVDPVGTVLVPGMLALAHLPVFGWAKPVPVDFRRLRPQRLGMVLVAAAGPGSNLVMALLAAVGLGLVAGSSGAEPGPVAAFVGANLANFIGINLFLALFNLLPVPPFDGSHIVEGALPRPAAAAYARLRPIGMVLAILLIVVLPQLFPSLHLIDRFIVPPVEWLGDKFFALAERIAGW